jgi:septal ring factor EnvC (AmiA/AmiB activator)
MSLKMNLEHVSQKQIVEIERLVGELLASLRKSKIQHETLTQSLQDFQKELGNLRRERFDAANPEYHSY